MPKIAIIGAGVSGLTLADHVRKFFEVTVFEKSNRVGGRISTQKHTPYVFDHGAQFFTVHNSDFLNFINELKQEGVVAHWDANFAEIDGVQVNKSTKWSDAYPHFVGIPSMEAIGTYLQDKLISMGVSIQKDTQISAIQNFENQWLLREASGSEVGLYDWVVTTTPSQQAAKLMPNCFQHKHVLESRHMSPCYALMLGFNRPLNLDWHAAHIKNSILSWMSVDSSKPARKNNTSVVIMSTNDWANENFDKPESWVTQHMLRAFYEIIRSDSLGPDFLHLKKWHFANAGKSMHKEVLIDKHHMLAACGDWTISGRVESAFLSAKKLGDSLSNTVLMSNF